MAKRVRNWEEDKTVRLLDNQRVWKRNHSFSGKLSCRETEKPVQCGVGDETQSSSAQRKGKASGVETLQPPRVARS